MPPAKYNLVKALCPTIGDSETVALGLGLPGFLSFDAAGVADGEEITYGLTDGLGGEVGRGVYRSSPASLERRTVLTSTNSGQRISLSGQAMAYITVAAEDLPGIVWQDFDLGSDDLHICSIPAGAILTGACVDILTAADDPDCMIRIITGGGSVIVDSSLIAPDSVGRYDAAPMIRFSGDADLVLSISPGSSTELTGVVLVQYQR